MEGRERFRDWMQELSDRTVAEMADVHFDIPEPIRRLECCLAPTNDGGIYYTSPSEDFSRPGRMWWSVPDGIERFATWRETTTVFHEGVPGHHLQGAQTMYRADLLNRWQRSVCWVSGHGEGWALYAERLMDDLGYLAAPGDYMGMLDGQSMRAARVIVDIGMHLELEIPKDNPFGFHPGETWTPALGLAFMRDHCLMEDEYIQYEVLRYLGWPGQAPSYKVGERIWLQCREEVRAAAGRRLRPEGVPPGGAGPRVAGAGPVPSRDGQAVTSGRFWSWRRSPPRGWPPCVRPAWSRSSSSPVSTSRR